MHLKRTADPTSEPITWAECKVHLKLDDDTEQAYVETLIAAAREYVEAQLGRALYTQTWTLKLDGFRDDGQVVKDGIITIPNPPLASVSSITYVDTNGTTQTLSASSYTVNTQADPGRIYEAYSYVWPDTRDTEDCVTITYVAGWSTVATIPKTIKQAMLMLVLHWFGVRQPVTEKPLSAVPMAVESLLAMNSHGWHF